MANKPHRSVVHRDRYHRYIAKEDDDRDTDNEYRQRGDHEVGDRCQRQAGDTPSVIAIVKIRYRRHYARESADDTHL